MFGVDDALRARLEYREGWATTPHHITGNDWATEHAWLLLDGEVLDLTWEVRSTRYLNSYAVPLDDLARHLIQAREYWFVYPERLRAIRPTTGLTVSVDGSFTHG
jgi:hypothetical protein